MQSLKENRSKLCLVYFQTHDTQSSDNKLYNLRIRFHLEWFINMTDDLRYQPVVLFYYKYRL